MKKIIPWKLLIAHLKEEQSAEDDALFQDWISQPGHAALFSEIEYLWAEIRKEAACDVDVNQYWRIVEERINKGQTRSLPIRKKARMLAAVAAVLVLTLGVSVFWLTKEEREIHAYAAYSGKSKVVLPDNSTIWLNSGSTLRYAGSFSRNRQVEMQGEASFDVVKDKKHPFIVSTSGVQVKVYGTYFNINSYEENEHIVVSLKEGSVALLLNGEESFLKPGEKAVINKEDLSFRIAPADLNLELLWANESIYFKSKSLGYICQYLEKWYHVEIEVDPEISESQLYTFTIKDDSLEAILRIMAKINPITYSFDDKNSVKIMKVQP